MCSRSSKSLRRHTIVVVPLFILWGCASLKTSEAPHQSPAAIAILSPKQESPLKNEPPDSTQFDQSAFSSQKPSLERSKKLKEAQSSTSTSGQSEKAMSVVTIPESTVVSKIFPDDIPSAPEGINLNTATLRLQASTQGIQVGDQFILSIEAQQVKDLFSAPFYLSYDPQQLEFVGITEGEFLKRDKNPTVFIYNVDPERGQVIIGLSRLGDVGGISGSGTLALATFKAKGPGAASVAFQNVDFKDVRLEPVNVISEVGEVQVR